MGSSKTPLQNKSFDSEQTAKLAVAFSGGLDSTVLLHSTVAAYGAENVIAFHVNHGIQDLANDWVIHCAKIAESYDIEFDFRILSWPEDVKQLKNLEAQARDARYEALAQMCVDHQVTHLLLGHHQDDQAETILIQLLRGSGLPGLSGMPQQRVLPKTPVHIWRPFMDLTRSDLEAYAREYQLEWIEDPSNANEQFTRNWIRHQIIPLLEKAQPQFRGNFSRSAAHLAEAQNLLAQLGDIDLQVMSTDAGLDIILLVSLRLEDPARANNAFRRWLFLQGLSMPSEERLGAWWQDLEKLRDASDHQLQWGHDGKHLRIWRQKLTVIDPRASLGHWEMRSVQEDSDELGLAQDIYALALEKGLLQEKERSGGEKIRTHQQRPRKTLKNLFQELDIPPWQRQAKILCLDNEVLAVSGVGLNIDVLTHLGPRVVPVFIQDWVDA
jgi:tRNA(Ile)-lysidine synthase